MPFRDRTGPEGKGSMTGRGVGDCGEINSGDKVTAQGWGFGRGRGTGRGFGRGRGGWWRRGGGFWGGPISVSPEQEINALEAQAKHLQVALQHINDQLEKLK